MEIFLNQWAIDVTYSEDVPEAIAVKSNKWPTHTTFWKGGHLWPLKMIHSILKKYNYLFTI